MFETVVEWENELIDFCQVNQSKIDEFKTSKILSLEKAEETIHIDQTVNKMISSANQQISTI